jgi:hypothetical protein
MCECYSKLHFRETKSDANMLSRPEGDVLDVSARDIE